jgi:triosephosphate isomerase (TIM)
MTTIGISLKMYFGLAQTLEWCARTATLAAALAPSTHELFVLPSFPALPAVVNLFDGSEVAVGAQDLAADDSGAQTGEVGGAMLAEIGCRYVEVGHAERRRLFGETEDVVAAKTATALRHGLTPILCLGEATPQPPAEAAAECLRQLNSALSVARTTGLAGPLVVAYEPFWAIGATEPAPDPHITEVCMALRDVAATLQGHGGSRVIYGGSAGPGLLTGIGRSVDGLFLGRFAHDPAALAIVLDEAAALDRGPALPGVNQ